MTSVAYRVEPPPPGWLWTAGGLVAGWLLAAFATGALYVVAGLLGAISHTYPSYPGALNDWPYPDNGLWSLAANVAVVVLVLLLTTKATSSWMRQSYEHFSEGRLALVLLVTGWLPLESRRPVGGFFGFVVAVVLIRYWVARHEDHLPARTAAILVAALAGVIGVYGLLHPLWTIDVNTSGSANAATNTIVIHNAGRVPVRVDGFRVNPSFGVVRPRRRIVRSTSRRTPTTSSFNPCRASVGAGLSCWEYTFATTSSVSRCTRRSPPACPWATPAEALLALELEVRAHGAVHE